MSYSISNNKFNKTPFCKVCKDAGKSKEEYTSHYVRESREQDAKVSCPTLLAQECRYCHKTGHTRKWCPVLSEKNNDIRQSKRQERDLWKGMFENGQEVVATSHGTNKATLRFKTTSGEQINFTNTFDFGDESESEDEDEEYNVSYPSIGSAVSQNTESSVYWSKLGTDRPNTAKSQDHKRKRYAAFERRMDEVSSEAIDNMFGKRESMCWGDDSDSDEC